MGQESEIDMTPSSQWLPQHIANWTAWNTTVTLGECLALNSDSLHWLLNMRSKGLHCYWLLAACGLAPAGWSYASGHAGNQPGVSPNDPTGAPSLTMLTSAATGAKRADAINMVNVEGVLLVLCSHVDNMPFVIAEAAVRPLTSCLPLVCCSLLMLSQHCKHQAVVEDSIALQQCIVLQPQSSTSCQSASMRG